MLNKDKKTWEDCKHFLWWPITFTKYRIENGRIYLTTGLFSTKEEECLLYRIMDITFERTLGNKICGTGTIRMTTKDASSPVILLENIADSKNVKDTLSQWVEEEREAKRVTGRDMYGASSHLDEYDGDL
ncbi:PH domain-containing protein [Anaerostipes faecalis]|uniref:PH domain-containing protein n=1 Tax=Anaerostipes faecalis TaxID=2738446 RepID=UPI003F11B0D2